MSLKIKQLTELLEPSVESTGFELWGLELVSQGRESILRVYIDGPEGVTVDDCAVVSHQVSGVLDVEDPIAGNYTLEVSSPGMDRPLFKKEQFESHRGHVVQLRLRIPFDGRRKFKGLLNGIEGEDVLLIVDQEEYLLPLELIDKANLVPQFEKK